MAEYIEREALLAGFNETIYKLRVSAGENAILQAAICFVQNSRDFVASFPAADVVEVRHGEWVDRYGGKYANQLYECSVCKEFAPDKVGIDVLGSQTIGWALTPYCPNCGAKMDGKGEGE